MEYNVQTLSSNSTEWKNNILLINEKDFQIKKEAKNEISADKEKDNENKTFSLLNASLIDNNNLGSNSDSIFVGTSSYNINIKPLNKEDKDKIFSSFREIINNNVSYDNEINKETDNVDKTFEYISKKLSVLQKLLLETIALFNEENKINDIKNNVDKVKAQLDLTIINFYKYHDLLSKKTIDYSFEEEIMSPIIYGDDKSANFEIIDSLRYHPNDLRKIGKKIHIINTNSDYEDAISNHNHLTDKNQLRNKNNNKINIIDSNENDEEKEKDDKKDNEFYNKDYDVNKIRKNLAKPLTFPPNLVKEMVTNFTQQKKSLPVYFNEPLSLGQKQCEKFYYLDLLNKAANEEKKEMQLCYISAFLIGEIFLNIGRTLKPFNSIIGETYEYFNNNLNFRFYSEQVSHKPPVNAYVG
jgi:hypothetical protein